MQRSHLPLLVTLLFLASALSTVTIAQQVQDKPAPPPLPSSAVRRGYGLWTADTMTKIGPASRPEAWPDDALRVRLLLARGEYEGFQIGILPAPGRALKNVRFLPTRLKGDAGIIDADNVSRYVVGCTPVPNTDQHVPDMLLPMKRFNVTADTACAVYVSVFAPPDTPPGVYKGAMTLLADGVGPMAIGLEIEVIDFTLPKGTGNCRTMFALQVEREGWAGGYRRYADFMLQHRLNPDDIYRHAPPSVADLEHFYRLGMNTFTVCKVSQGWSHAPITALFDQLAESPHGAEIRKMAVFYGYDEKGKDQWPSMKACFEDLEKDFPDVLRLTTAHVYMDWEDPVALMKDLAVDAACPWLHPGYPEYYRIPDHDKLREAGLQLWGYNINFQTHYPLIQPRTTLWQMYFLKADGWLYYCVNGWANDAKPIDPGNGPFIDYVPDANAQAELLYHGVDGPIGSLRLAGIRDGIEDWEYLNALAEKAGDIEVARELCERVSWGVLKWVQVPAELLAVRREVADWLTRPYLARSPSPSHRSMSVPLDATLSWQVDRPEEVKAFRLYFGTDRDAVATARPGTACDKGQIAGATFNPGELKKGPTYYWRVDEIADEGVHAGYVWSFSTADPAPAPPAEPPTAEE